MRQNKFDAIYKPLFAVFIFFHFGNSQSGILPGTWKSHLSYKEGRLVTQSDDKVIYAAQRGIFTIDKADLSVEFLSKENNLSEVDVSGLFYDDRNQQLFVVYSSNFIDILSGSTIFTVSDIANNSTIIGSKTINDITFASAENAYIATDFGILGFSPKQKEFQFTTFTQQKVYSVCENRNSIYAATENGLYFISKSDSRISDFNAWQKILPQSGLPSADQIKKVRTKASLLVVWQDNAIYIQNNQDTRNAIEDEKGRVWYADEWEPVRYTEGLANGECRQLSFSTPYTNDASNIRFKGEKAYVASGGVTEDYQYKFTRYGFYTYEQGDWINFTQEKIPEILEYDFLNLFCLAPDPFSSNIYLGSYYNGLLSFDEKTGKAEHWNKDNSILQGVIGDPQRTRVAGLAFDKKGNLWISNYGSTSPLVVKTKEGSWHKFSLPGSSQLAEIAIDQSGNKWIVVPGVGNGILVYNEGENISDTGDDTFRFINRNNSILTGNKVNSVLVDLDGAVWVGTDQGPVIFDCGNPFQESVCRGSTRPVVVDGIPSLLLRDEDILCMEVDGANRKWFGTRNGIFVQSTDGTTQIDQFTTGNSPLLSNRVVDLAYNSVTGDMMIVTASGIQTYRTFTTGGGRTHSNSVYAFPNPVRPEYEGLIYVKGLVRDANVKITDVQGRLVYETRALGGQAVWDGRDYHGLKASPGVYLVFSANENTSGENDSYVTKILIID